MRLTLSTLLFAGVMLFTIVASAGPSLGGAPQDADEAFLNDETPEETPSEEGPLPEAEDEDQAFLTDTEKAEIEAPEEEKDIGRLEDPNTPYFSVGGRFRWIMIPEWFIKMFGVDAKRASEYESSLPLISSVGGGAEFTYRKGGFDITAAVWYVNLGWKDPISFKGSDESGGSWEVISNDLQGILITADFIWSTSITDWVAITYGAGIGLGIPFGDIIRNEARQGDGDEEEGVYPCDGEEDEDPWCSDDEEYGVVYDIPTKIIPWINLLVGARFKPHRHVAIYVDGGFGLGFQLGVRAGYIF